MLFCKLRPPWGPSEPGTFDFVDICTENELLISPYEHFFYILNYIENKTIRSLLILRMFINSLRLYSDFRM